MYILHKIIHIQWYKNTGKAGLLDYVLSTRQQNSSLPEAHHNTVVHTRTSTNINFVTGVNPRERNAERDSMPSSSAEHTISRTMCTSHPWFSHLCHQKCISPSLKTEIVLNFSWLMPVHTKHEHFQCYSHSTLCELEDCPFNNSSL